MVKERVQIGVCTQGKETFGFQIYLCRNDKSDVNYCILGKKVVNCQT
jgi:hypothetical protein